MVDFGFRALSELLSRIKFAQRVGLTHGGARDMYDALGYERSIALQKYRERYERNEMAFRVVEAKPTATWRGGAELIENDDPEVITPFEEAFSELNDRLNIWPTFKQADVYARIGHYSVILIGAPGRLEQPLEKVAGPQDIAYLTPYLEEDAEIATVVQDPTNPRFAQPLTYNLKRTMVAGKAQVQVRGVHYTRVIHIAEGLQLYGKPCLDPIWNRLDDLEKVVGGGSEAFWKRAHQGTIFNIDPDVPVAEGEVENMQEKVEEFEHKLRRYLALRGVEAKTLGSDVADFSLPVTSIISLIAGGSEIPQRILLGSERGELASTTDRDNWNERVSDRRMEFAWPNVIRQTTERFIQIGALPEPKDPYEVWWPDADAMDPERRAALGVQWAEMNAKMGTTVVTEAEIREHCLGLEALDESQIEDVETEEEDELRAARRVMQMRALRRIEKRPSKERIKLFKLRKQLARVKP